MTQGYGYRSERRLRKENQDTFGVFEFNGITVLVVCDGMGGHVGGRQASSIAVRTIHDEFAGTESSDYRATLRRAVEAANRAIYETARKNYRLMGMGTTCVAAVVHGTTAHVAHVGDSRAYLVRENQIRALTRDHTMVNLFVDAELLSPEDAATHPEAHVLSRSLGVERQVEVELAEPLHLQQNDRILICSDGVHGVVGTSGLGNIDWRNPQDGVDAALASVERADGDDNATLLVYGQAILGQSAPTTLPPDLASLEEEARQAEVQVALQPVRRPTPMATQPVEEDVVPVEHLDPDIATASDKAVARKPAPKRPGPGVSRKVIVAGLLAAAATVAIVLMIPHGKKAAPVELPPEQTAAVEATQPATTDLAAPAGAADGEEIQLASAGGRGMFRQMCLDCTGSFALPSAAAYLSGAEDPEVAVAFFAPEVPPGPKRTPQTNAVYDRPPPNGPEGTKAVRAARNHRCREALDTVRGAIQRSIDYASLYSVAWFCFNDTDQATLAHARAATYEAFLPLLPHFEGEGRLPAPATSTSGSDGATGRQTKPGSRPDPKSSDSKVVDAKAGDSKPGEGKPADAKPGATASDKAQDRAAAEALAASNAAASASAALRAAIWDKPMADLWKLPATGGIEYRLALFETDTDVQGFRDIMIDLSGEPTIADHLAADVLLEATAAAAVARLDEPSVEAVQGWARRVYVASRSMTGEVGELIRAHRPEVAGQIEALLFEATGGDDGLASLEDGRPNDAVPPVVARAQAAGLAGEMFDRFDFTGEGTHVGGGMVPSDGAGANQVASADPATNRAGYRGPVRRTYSRSYARPSRTSAPTAAAPTDAPTSAQNFDWEEFGYLKVWYPRRRMPRILHPYQAQQGAGLQEETAP